MREAQTPHFYDFEIFEPVAKPQNQLSLSLETPGHLKSLKIPQALKTNIFLQISDFWKPGDLTILEKTGTEK